MHKAMSGLTSITPFRPVRRRLVIIEQDPLRGAVKVLILTCSQRPQEGRQAEQTQEQSDRDQDNDDIHIDIITPNLCAGSIPASFDGARQLALIQKRYSGCGSDSLGTGDLCSTIQTELAASDRDFPL